MNIGHLFQALIQHFTGGGHPQNTLKLPGIAPQDLHGPFEQRLQQLQPMQEVPYKQPMPQSNQWNPNMGGAPKNNNFLGRPDNVAPIPSFMGNRYAQNPYDPQFVGRGAPDPMIFGYPADNTAQSPANMYHNLFRGR